MIDLDFLIGEVLVEVVPREYALWTVFRPGTPVPGLYATLTAPIAYVDTAGARHAIDPLESDSVARVRDLVGLDVVAASADDGVLRLVFRGGSELMCPPDDSFEAWEVVGGYPWELVVCTPGGELAAVDAREPSFGVTPPGNEITVIFHDGRAEVPLEQFRDLYPDDAAKLDEMLDAFRMPRPQGFPPADDDD